MQLLCLHKNAQVKKRSNYLCLTNQYFSNIEGCRQGKVDQKHSPPKIQLKNGTIFNMDIKKQTQNILKQKYKTIRPYIQFMGSFNNLLSYHKVKCCHIIIVTPWSISFTMFLQRQNYDIIDDCFCELPIILHTFQLHW